MTKVEFEGKLGREVSEKDYSVIEYVYNFHPSISNTEGKTQIAELYKLGGMRLIRDMVQTATQAESLENNIRKANEHLADLKKQYEDLQYGREMD